MLASYVSSAPTVVLHRSAFAPAPVGESAARPANEVFQAIEVLREFGASSGEPFGDHEAEALGVLYRRYAATLLRLTRRLTGNTCDAQDIVHDVFVRLPQTLQKYQPGNFEGWLKRVTSRAALMGLRKRNRRREESYSTLAEAGAFDEVGPDEFDAVENAAEVRRALGQLREPLRQVVSLRVYAELTHQEIADLLGITPNTSEVRLCRAIKQLRAILTQPSPAERLSRTGA